MYPQYNRVRTLCIRIIYRRVTFLWRIKYLPIIRQFKEKIQIFSLWLYSTPYYRYYQISVLAPIFFQPPSPQIITHISCPFFVYLCPLPTLNRLNIWVGQVKRGAINEDVFIVSWVKQGSNIAFAEFFWSLNKGRVWCYNILGDNNEIISHILQLDPINSGSVLLNYNPC